MNPEWNISACGLNCATCDFYKARQGDTDKQQEIIDWFKQDYGQTITPEQTMCSTCMGPDTSHWSPKCAIRLCAKEKQVKHCSDCPEFVCSKLENFANDGHSSHRQAVENLRAIKRIGLDNWKQQNTP